MHLPTVFFVLAATALCESSPEDAMLAKVDNEFGVKLLKALSGAQPESNVFFSPTGILAALGMAYTGAGGHSQLEFCTVLGFAASGFTTREAVLSAYKKLLTGNTSDKVTLEVANSVLIRNDFQVLDGYKSELENVFGAQLRSVDFVRDGAKVAKEIDDWVSRKTKGKIQNLLGNGLPMNTVMFIVNAIYFKGSWVTKFNTRNTAARPFYNKGKHVVQKETMALLSRMEYADFSELGFRAVELPYNGNRISMIILLPEEKTGLHKVREVLNAAMFAQIDEKLHTVKVDLRLPKFEQETEYNLEETLRVLGSKSIFTEQANFTRICKQKSLRVSEVKHKAMVEVNEEGTVAAAVTSVRVRGITSARRVPVEVIVPFHVEHPFIFYIKDETTGHVLFLGEVHNL